MEKMLNMMDEPKSLSDAWELENEAFDANTLLSTIINKGMTFEPLYTDPRFFYMMNTQWWNKWKNVFEKWFYAATFEYEPLWDRNGYETVHEDTADVGTNDTSTSGRKTIDNDTTGTKSSTEVMDDDTTYSKDGTSKETVDEDTSFSKTSQTTEQASGKDKTTHDSDRDISVENKVSAYDSSSYSPHDQSHTDDTLNSENTETTYGKKVQTDGTESGTGTDDKTTDNEWEESGNGTDDRTTTYNETTSGTDDTTEVTTGTIDNDTTNDRDFDRDYHSWGNWGISQTSQKLLMSEYEVRYWNLYEHIADIFCDEMLIGVY